VPLSQAGATLLTASQFTERTPGAFIENSDIAITYRFSSDQQDDADRVWARRQAAEAQNHIWDSLGEQFGALSFIHQLVYLP